MGVVNSPANVILSIDTGLDDVFKITFIARIRYWLTCTEPSSLNVAVENI